jgi:hypothetical protein
MFLESFILSLVRRRLLRFEQRRTIILLGMADRVDTFFRKVRPLKWKRVIEGVALTPLVGSRIDAVFSLTLRDAAVGLIREQCGAGLPLMHTGIPENYDRIRLAVIKLSGGTIEGLERNISAAHIDWRDILIEAGFGHDVDAHLRWDPRLT